MARLKREPVRQQQSESETESDATMCSEGDEEAGRLWAEAEDDLSTCMVESLKDKLAEIHPGIGDWVRLAKFVAFIESNSTCL